MDDKRLIDILTKVVKTIIDALVEFPEEAKIHDILITPKSITVYLKVMKSDFGKIIGKHGKTVRCINYLVSIIKQKHFPDDNRMTHIEIVEDIKQ
jgi:predicted RNA-binding protein YlqC (UPF0109 family)